MNQKQKRRLLGIGIVAILLMIATALVLFALKQNINLFYTPTQLLNASISQAQTIRVGGYVKKNSVHYDKSGQQISFVVTDNINDLLVNYHGILPSLFREGQGVVITGNFQKDLFSANQVLAKHDEKYMPWPLSKTLQKGAV